MRKSKTKKRTQQKANPTQDPKPRIFPTIANAAAALKISVETLKLAKRAGCPAFSGRGSVNSNILLDWLKANPGFAVNTTTVKGQIDLEILRRHQRNNDREDGKLIPKAVVAETIRRIFGSLNNQIEQLLCNEYPTAVAGLDPAQARVYGKRVFDKYLAACCSFSKEWSTTQ